MTANDGSTLEGVSAGTMPGVRVARDIPLPPGRGWWRLLELG